MIFTFPIDDTQITIDKMETLEKIIILKFHKIIKIRVGHIRVPLRDFQCSNAIYVIWQSLEKVLKCGHIQI